MPARLTLAACALLLPVLGGGCAQSGRADGEADDGDRPGCQEPTVTGLGIPFRGVRTAFFRTSGGEVLVGVSDLGDDLFGDVTQTGVDIGPGETPPEVEQGSSRVRGAVASVTVHQGRLTRVSLPAGRYWLVSSNGGRIQLHTCPDVEIADVRTAGGEPGSAFNSPG